MLPKHSDLTLDLARYPYIAVDIESTGLKWWRDKMFSCAITVPGETEHTYESYYYDIRRPECLKFLRGELPRARLVVNHNIKFDMHFLREAGVPALQQVDCTMIRAALLDEHRFSYSLDDICRDAFGQTKESDLWKQLAYTFGGRPTRKAQIANLPRAPEAMVAKYAMRDTELAIKLWEHQNKGITDQDLVKVWSLEKRLLPHIYDMEYRGVRVSLDAAEKAVKQIGGKITTRQKELDRLAGFPVNVNPSNSLKKLIKPVRTEDEDGEGTWKAKDGTALEETGTGAACLDKAALERMRMPEAALVLEIRQMRRTKETFLEGHILGHHHNSVIHANINQTKSENDKGTGTGRFSINDPALQQIHKRNKEIASIVRACFIPDLGQDWHCRDWSQMDFRVFAHYAKEPRILRMYQDDPESDFHQMVADMTGLPRTMTPGVQGNAKQINLGLVFGMGPGKLAAEMGLPHTTQVGYKGKKYLTPGPEAESVFNRYNAAVPGVSSLLSDAATVAKNRGYVRTALGRRIRFPGGKATYKAGGLIFQGTAADALKLKICEVCDYLKNSDGRLMVNVHDEFDSSLPKGAVGKRMDETIRDILEDFAPGSAMPLRVPIRSDGGKGPNWWEASK